MSNARATEELGSRRVGRKRCNQREGCNITAVTILMFLAVTLRALVQDSVGFGFALIVVPVLALV